MMQKIKFSDGTILTDIKFAATNSIDGRLVICIENFATSELGNIQTLFFDGDKTKSITLINNDHEVETWEKYSVLSNFFINLDSNLLTIWMKRG